MKTIAKILGLVGLCSVLGGCSMYVSEGYYCPPPRYHHEVIIVCPAPYCAPHYHHWR